MRYPSKETSMVVGGVTLITLLFQLFNNMVIAHPLFYHRTLFLEQFLWQGITPSLVHLSWRHWFFNLLNLYTVILLFPCLWRGWQLLWFLLLGSYFTLMLLYLFTPNIIEYAGFSGLLYGLMIYGVIHSFSQERLIASVVGLLVAFKLLMGSTINHLLGLDDFLNGIHVVEEIHWYGVLFALLYFGIERWSRK